MHKLSLKIGKNYELNFTITNDGNLISYGMAPIMSAPLIHDNLDLDTEVIADCIGNLQPAFLDISIEILD